ncbi:glycosyltransferase [Niameybacter massiliensis]|uniref:Hyaluronan synthase n=1 Tax=Holtiella tumoricola TaxID=3018743 RepID=A0AA42DN03_9FIRM|nr:glycosyltransferase [Holtiella tumoricola]MDA3731994.1 glycosyltransferase [Holtiella tumoricola]
MRGYIKKKISAQEKIEDKLLQVNQDRRLLPYVPDPEHIRSDHDRRGDSYTNKKSGLRYCVAYKVKVICETAEGNKEVFFVEGINISTTGMLLRVAKEEQIQYLKNASRIKLKFQIEPGSMPEGLEMRVSLKAQYIRDFDEEGFTYIGVQFETNLYDKARQTKDIFTVIISSILLAAITFFIILMRVESIIYFKFNKWMYLYSIVTAVFLLTRYIFGACYRPERINPGYTPGVTILIPCFNEETWIQQTIISCMNQDYPIDKLEVIVVDDCSNDQSVEKIKEIIERLKGEGERYDIKNRLSYIVQEQNKGKREALAKGSLVAKHELVVFVDSDSFLDPLAIRYLVQPFKDPKMGGVAGRTDVANTYTNTLTKMQSVRYYIAFRIMKAAEAYFDSVTCLSGPLACYRKDIVIKNIDAWLNQSFLGQKATFGDDRAMTNFVLAHHRTSYQDGAVCSTVVPNKYKVFLKQQMRWKRSWLRESLMAGKFMWRKEPFAAISFYIGLLVPILAPIVVIYNLIIVPITQKTFPTTFLVGLLMMALLMSIAQLLLRRSTTWLFGLVFCLFYEGILLWQMPIAWVTFWKSTWGTRMTPSDIEALEKKEQSKEKRTKNRKMKKQKHRVNETLEEREDYV